MRIPVEVALEGGQSDCRNRSLQRMFSLIGLGEQAGSGIPRVIENWKTRHYRLPELWESQDPESTLMRLRTVSLLPDETLDALRRRFGAAFDSLTVDLAGAEDDFSAPLTSSAHSTPRSEHSLPTSERLPLSSEHSEGGSVHPPPEAVEVAEDPALLAIADPVRSNRRSSPETTREVILELCRGRFLTLSQLATLLGRSSDSLRQRFVKSMVDDDRVLERRFPQQPNHEAQAYRTKES